MFKNPKKELATEFINRIEILANDIQYGKLSIDNQQNEINLKSYLDTIVKDSRELIAYNEWYIALENALVNLCEIDYKMDKKILEPIEEIFKNPEAEIYLKTIQELKKVD